VTTTIPKFRIKDVNIHEKPLCCGNIGYDACLTRFCCATFCKCGMVAKPQKTVEFILRAESGASSWAPTPTVEVKVMTDLPEELILHYVYGPLLNSGDQTHGESYNKQLQSIHSNTNVCIPLIIIIFSLVPYDREQAGGTGSYQLGHGPSVNKRLGLGGGGGI